MDDETIEVETMTIACDGGGGPLDHPKVHLHLEEETLDVGCHYCSLRFKLKEGANVAAGH